MKNLLIYISPTGSFNNPRPDLTNDAFQLVKVQIENSVDLGWKKEDILLFTNFPFQYGPIKATVLKKVEFLNQLPRTSKINGIVKLFEKGIIKKGQLYWFHDLDAFQLAPIRESELNLGKADIGMADYGRFKRWNTGSIFFKLSSKDIFYRIGEIVHEQLTDEEKALDILVAKDKKIGKRIKTIDRTYNFTAFNLKASYKKAIKPIKVVHFHPLAEIRQLNIKKPLDYFKGVNYIRTPLITRRLLKIFKVHRIR
jgi:hypothetical protein